MSDSFVFKSKVKRVKTEFLSQFNEEKGISQGLNNRLFYLAIVGLICNLITWIIWIKPIFEPEVWGSFAWYVIKPFVVQTIIVIISILLRFALIKVESKSEISYKNASAVTGSFVYTAFFVSLVFFYRDMPIFWLFAVCPMLLASFYRSSRWFYATLICTAVSVVVVILGFFEVSTYRIDNVPPAMMAVEAIVIAALIGTITVALHERIELAFETVAKAEATRVAKDAFFTRISHQVRTPINAILGMDEMILSENINNDVENYALVIKSAGQSLLSMVNDIIDTSRLESGRLELRNEDFDIASIVNDCVNVTKFKSVEKGLELRVHNSPYIPSRLNGDEVRLRQIINNILSNAVKFTHDGYVDFNVDYENTDEEHINLIVTVSDTGCGITEDEMAHLFESFERFDEKKNTYVAGAGLGLSLTKQLVDLLGGTIKVESEPGIGSTFTVIAPFKVVSFAPMGDYAKRVTDEDDLHEPEPKKIDNKDAKILVVDDVQMNIDVFRGLLKRMQLNIDSALSGEKALLKLQKKKYDIIFMDHLMPDMDGVETLKRLREMDTPNNDTPVVVITANVGPDSEDEYKKMGFSEYISKPVKGKVLESVVNKYLRILA